MNRSFTVSRNNNLLRNNVVQEHCNSIPAIKITDFDAANCEQTDMQPERDSNNNNDIKEVSKEVEVIQAKNEKITLAGDKQENISDISFADLSASTTLRPEEEESDNEEDDCEPSYSYLCNVTNPERDAPSSYTNLEYMVAGVMKLKTNQTVSKTEVQSIQESIVSGSYMKLGHTHQESPNTTLTQASVALPLSSSTNTDPVHLFFYTDSVSITNIFKARRIKMDTVIYKGQKTKAIVLLKTLPSSNDLQLLSHFYGDCVPVDRKKFECYIQFRYDVLKNWKDYLVRVSENKYLCFKTIKFGAQNPTHNFRFQYADPDESVL